MMKIYGVQYDYDDESSINLDVYENVALAEAEALAAARESVRDMTTDTEIYTIVTENLGGLKQYSVEDGVGNYIESWKVLELTLHHSAL
jgi:hypothetical protein